MADLKLSSVDGKLYNGDISLQEAATVDPATVLEKMGARIAGTAFPITTTGIVTFGDQRTTSGVGAIVANKCTAVEYGNGIIHQTVLTLTLSGATHDLDLAGDADCGTGIKIYDFPAGRILILGATINASAVCNDAFNASANDVYNLSCGSVSAVQAAEGDLTDTEVDIIPKTVIDTVSNTTLTNAWHAALAASAAFDGTTDALDLYVNASVLNASTTKAVTIAITGTLTVTWINLGDY